MEGGYRRQPEHFSANTITASKAQSSALALPSPNILTSSGPVWRGLGMGCGKRSGTLKYPASMPSSSATPFAVWHIAPGWMLANT
eukprot:7540-Eustigmatos_ZCMA.PRE.1